ncbi:unnamed protein product [Camellia sinensis]
MCLLHHLRANLSLFLITITLLTMISSVFGQPTYNAHACSGMPYNDPPNIKTLLGSLSSKAAHKNTFYKDTSNNLNGLYLCRGDVATDMCQKCVEAAIQEIQQPSRCQSNNGAVIWYDECMLHYSVDNFFGTAETDPRVWMWNVGNTTSPDDPNYLALDLMSSMILNVETQTMYERDESTVTKSDGTRHRYGMVQCSRDISGKACNTCLTTLKEFSKECCQGKKGWRILAPSCNLRYEEYPFLTLPVTPPVPPPMPTTTSKGNVGENTTKIVLITVPVSTFLVVTFGFYFYRLFGKEAKHEKVLQGMSQEILLNNMESQTTKRFMVKGLEVQDEDDSRDMHYFDLTTLQIATNNFSDANKLGQGGFGPVYKGKLHDGKEIAVKRLSSNSGQGLEEFRTEVKLIVKLQHRNLVRLLGCCIEKDEKLLVYEYMANTSLDAFLFDSTKCKELDWAKRENIVTDFCICTRTLGSKSSIET